MTQLGASKWLQEGLRLSAPAEGIAWLEEKRRQVMSGAPQHLLFRAFSLVPGKVGKADLPQDAVPLQWAGQEYTGWSPVRWSADQAARTLLVISIPDTDAGSYVATVERLFELADWAELVILYQMLPLLSHAVYFRRRAIEGVRSNIASVFNAVACDNPYPFRHFEESAWNQMILKAVFIGTPFRNIIGLDQRANKPLANMLINYAHECWAAGRPVTPEVWRPVGPFVDHSHITDLERLLNDPDPLQQQAATLALSQSPSPKASQLLATREDLRQMIETGRLTWTSFAAQ